MLTRSRSTGASSKRPVRDEPVRLCHSLPASPVPETLHASGMRTRAPSERPLDVSSTSSSSPTSFRLASSTSPTPGHPHAAIASLSPSVRGTESKRAAFFSDTKRQVGTPVQTTYRRQPDDAEEAKRLSFTLGEGVLNEIEELALWPLFSTAEKRSAAMRLILKWEAEEPLRVGYWPLSADANVMDAAQARQWQTLVRTHLRRLSHEQLHARIADAPALLAHLMYKPTESSRDAGDDESDRRALLAMSLPDLLGAVLRAGELDVCVRAYFLAERPDVRRAACASPARPTPLPTIDAYVDDAIRQCVLTHLDELERRAVTFYLQRNGITTPRGFAALAPDSPILGEVSRRLHGEGTAGYDVWLRIRCALKLPLSVPELARYCSSYVLPPEQKRAYDSEYAVWKEAFHESLSSDRPENLRILIERAQIRHTSRRRHPYRPRTPWDPTVTQRGDKPNEWDASSVVVRGRVVGFRRTTDEGGIRTAEVGEAPPGDTDTSVTVKIDADQLPWLDGRAVSVDDRMFTVTPRPGSANLEWHVSWADACTRILRLLAAEAGDVARPPPLLSDVEVYVQPPIDMIRRLTLALADVGERLEVQRTPRLVGGGGTSTVEGRVLGGARDGSAVWVWVDGHVVEFSSPHLKLPPTFDVGANIGNLVGTRRESAPTPFMYDIAYSTPLVGTTAARIERMQRHLPPSIQHVPGITDLIASMLR